MQTRACTKNPVFYREENVIYLTDYRDSAPEDAPPAAEPRPRRPRRRRQSAAAWLMDGLASAGVILMTMVFSLWVLVGG